MVALHLHQAVPGQPLVAGPSLNVLHVSHMLLLCNHLPAGYQFVSDGTAVFEQGQIGNCM